MDKDDLRRQFAERFAGDPKICSAPGRVNLIGEHTDYNEGFVLPIAIEFRTWAAVRMRPDTKIQICSTNQESEVIADQRELRARGDWSDYVLGVFSELLALGLLNSGADILIHGEVPMGAGLSSSAAIEVAVGLALIKAAGVAMKPTQLALLCQRAENRFVGVQCGIMDQFIACNAVADHATMLDCRTLTSTHLPVPRDVQIVICNTMVKHKLATGEYNRRRDECREGVKLLAQRMPEIRALRDVSFDQFERCRPLLPEILARRCRHVITENQRVLRAADALRDGDLHSFGFQMSESHESLRDDFEVSCEELDLMVELARSLPGVYGARMTGGGFGGCTVSLVEAAKLEGFERSVRLAYHERTGIVPDVYVSRAAECAAEE